MSDEKIWSLPKPGEVWEMIDEIYAIIMNEPVPDKKTVRPQFTAFRVSVIGNEEVYYCAFCASTNTKITKEDRLEFQQYYLSVKCLDCSGSGRISYNRHYQEMLYYLWKEEN